MSLPTGFPKQTSRQPVGAAVWNAHAARSLRLLFSEAPKVSSQVPPASLVKAIPTQVL
jgi:hypothetical protein